LSAQLRELDGEPTVVPQLEGNTSCGRVSPQGQWVAFLHDVGDGYWSWYEVVVVNQDGAIVEPFERDLWVAGPPIWSPDGKLAVAVRQGVRIGLVATGLDSGERWWLLPPHGVPTDVVLAPGRVRPRSRCMTSGCFRAGRGSPTISPGSRRSARPRSGRTIVL
jgi:hypothetical protein